MYFGGAPKGVVAPDGRFTISGVPPGRYVIDVNWTAKSSVVGGQDTLDFPLEFAGDRDVTDAVVTLTDRHSQLNGTLTNSAGKPALDYVIVAVASDSRYWNQGSRRIRMVHPDHTGQFNFGSMPAGQYQISVIEDVEGGQLNNPEFLTMLARTSISVSIPDGGKVTQNLRVK